MYTALFSLLTSTTRHIIWVFMEKWSISASFTSWKNAHVPLCTLRSQNSLFLTINNIYRFFFFIKSTTRHIIWVFMGKWSISALPVKVRFFYLYYGNNRLSGNWGNPVFGLCRCSDRTKPTSDSYFWYRLSVITLLSLFLLPEGFSRGWNQGGGKCGERGYRQLMSVG